jgi:membrane protease YdiL (CAAX protease family)
MLYLMFFEWTPGFAALLTFALYPQALGSLVWKWLPVRQTLASYALPLVYILPVYLLTWFFVHGSFHSSSFLISSAATVGFSRWPRMATFCLFVPLSLSIGLLTRFPYTLGEELGWRGFLLPALRERYGFTVGCLITGVVWALWHYLLLYAFGLFSGSHAATKIPFFTMMVIGLSFVFGWLRLKTNSLWPCVLMHASHNAFLQTFFDPLTSSHGKTAYITSEFGCGLMRTVGMMAIWLTLARKKQRWTRSDEAVSQTASASPVPRGQLHDAVD